LIPIVFCWCDLMMKGGINREGSVAGTWRKRSGTMIRSMYTEFDLPEDNHSPPPPSRQ